MFTIEQIAAAHSKVKSGADFPGYIQDLIQLGVTHYVTFVSDGHTDFFGNEDFSAASPPKYDPLPIAPQSNVTQFKMHLKEHQEGKTDFLSFCTMSAQMGVNKWVVRTEAMTCTYVDIDENIIHEEVIPQP